VSISLISPQLCVRLTTFPSCSKLTKYEDAPAAAFVGHVYVLLFHCGNYILQSATSADEAFKGAASMSFYITSGSESVGSPWNLATGRNGSIWQWYQEPDNVWRFHRFTAAMKGGADRFPPSIYTDSIDWKSITADSIVVDIGGNVGKVAYELYKSFPHLKYVIQDLPPVVKDAKDVRHSYSSVLHA
jgi:hypothetical protein